MSYETLTTPQRQNITDSLLADINELGQRHGEDLPIGEDTGEISPTLLASLEGEVQTPELPENQVENRWGKTDDTEAASAYSTWIASETEQFHTEVDQRASAFETRYAGESLEVAQARHNLETEMLSFAEHAHVKREDVPKLEEPIVKQSEEQPESQPEALQETESPESKAEQTLPTPAHESTIDEQVAGHEENFHPMELQELITPSGFDGATDFTPTEIQEMYLTEYKRLRKLKSFEGAWQHFRQPDGRANDLEYTGYEKNPEAYLTRAQQTIEEQLTVAELYTETHHHYGNQAFEKFEEALYEKFGRKGINFDYRTSDGEKLTQWRPGVRTIIKQGEDGVMHLSFDYDDQVAENMYEYIRNEKQEQNK